MRVLIACEFSGVVREAFKARGHDAWSCDLLETEIPGQHIVGDVTKILNDNWDLMVSHPPCTYLTNSGVRWFYSKDHNANEGRWLEMHKAVEFFNTLKQANIPKICIENPIPHKYARNLIGKYDQIVQPWQFGHNEVKATCFWLKNLPKLVPTNIVEGRKPRVHFESPSPERWKNRSRTLNGIAAAMSQQWS